MSLIKDLVFIGSAFAVGFLVGNSKNSNTKKLVESYVEKGKKIVKDAKTIISTAIENLEDVDSKELKVNLLDGFEYLKNKILEIIEIDPSEKSSSKTLSKTSEETIKKDAKKQNTKEQDLQPKKVKNKKK